jgi:ABC-2 type transport system ATP-binding protein
VLGQDSTSLTPEVRARIGFVNEEHTLPEWMRVDELTHMQRKQYPRWNQARYDGVLRNFNVQARQKVRELSRGERAGVSLALALGQNPELLVLDEPTLGLDMVAKRTLLESLLYTDAGEASTIIYCSHQMEEIERIADNLVIIERGRLRHMSEPDELCSRVRLWAAEFPAAIDTSTLPGLLELQRIDGISHLMMLDAPAGFDAQLGNMGARNITSSAVPLGRAVSAMLAAGHISRADHHKRTSHA